MQNAWDHRQPSSPEDVCRCSLVIQSTLLKLAVHDGNNQYHQYRYDRHCYNPICSHPVILQSAAASGSKGPGWEVKHNTYEPSPSAF